MAAVYDYLLLGASNITMIDITQCNVGSKNAKIVQRIRKRTLKFPKFLNFQI